MSQKPTSSHTIGIEIDGSILKATQLSLSKGVVSVDRLYEIKFDPNSDQSISHVLNSSEEGRNLLDQSNKQLSITTLNTHEVLIRSLDLKLKKERDIDAVLAFQMEPILPYPVEQAILDRIILSQNNEGTSLSVLAVKRDHLNNHLHQWKDNQIEPEVVSCVPVSLVAFGNEYFKSEFPYIIVNLGLEQISCVLVKDNQLISSQALSSNINSLNLAWQEDSKHLGDQISSFYNFNFSSIDPELFPETNQLLILIRQELTRVLYALSKQIKGREVTAIAFTGEGIKCHELMNALNESLNKELLSPHFQSAFNINSDQLLANAVCTGSALSTLPKSTSIVNFRQNEFAYPHPWKRYRVPLATFFLSSLILSSALYLLGEVYLSYQRDNLKRDYVELLSVMHKSYPTFETEYNAKNPGGPHVDENGVLPVSQLTPDEIRPRLAFLDKELSSSPDSFPLQPNTPKVSDVLAWLNSHPNVVGKDDAGALLPLIQIENFSYNMVKRPELKKKQEHYQVKVEIEFSSLTPKHAREFHDALIAPNDIVDPKGEVKWSTNKGKYKTSFFLKDRTVYSSGQSKG